MAEAPVHRRLAAIVAADIVGYSRMMDGDEAGTIGAVKALREDILAPRVAENGGRVFKTMGDGFLIEFPSAVGATRCALQIQQALEANASASDGITLRIGINLGDVVIEGDDVFGDGVNVAARLEGLCEPGEIYVSAVVRDQIDGKVDAPLADLGERALKNISRPVRIYRVGGKAAEGVPGGTPGGKPAPPNPDRPSIAVLAFDNMSDDAEQTYFADGIAEDIITDLSKVSGLIVIARNSSFAYKGQSMDLRRICGELGVRYILEGSVRKAGKRIRINAQMIDGTNGAHVWADRYDRDLADIFEVQDEVTREIVSALKVALTTSEETDRAARRKVDPEAYDLLVKGRARIYEFTADALAEARSSLERAIAIDPDMAAAHAWLSTLHSTEHNNRWNDAGPDHLNRAIAYAETAQRVDPNEPHGHHAMALAKLWRRDLEGAHEAAERAVALNANFASGYTALANAQDFLGDHEAAVVSGTTALRLDPQYDVAMQLLGRALFALKRYDEAAAQLERRIALQPNTDMSRAFLAAVRGHQGRVDDAKRLWDEIRAINPDFSVARIREILPYKTPDVLDHLAAGLVAAGIAE